MPTLGLKVQQNGFFQGWLSIVGATFGFEAVDDSAGTTHDGATTHITIDKANTVSFPMFYQAEGLQPVSITLNVAAQRGGATHPQLLIGFYRSGVTAFSGSLFNPTSSYTVTSRTFSVNPFTGAAWVVEDLVGLEACVKGETGVNGNNDVTLISGNIDYVARRSWHWPEPQPKGLQ